MQYANKASTTWKTELERIEAGERREREGGGGGGEEKVTEQRREELEKRLEERLGDKEKVEGEERERTRRRG